MAVLIFTIIAIDNSPLLLPCIVNQVLIKAQYHFNAVMMIWNYKILEHVQSLTVWNVVVLPHIIMVDPDGIPWARINPPFAQSLKINLCG